MLDFLLDHSMLVRLVAAPASALLALSLAAAALRSPGDRRGRHGKRRGVRVGLPTEIRRHRRGGREHTWADTLSLRVVPPPTPHVLDETSPESRRNRAANRFETTEEITRDDLAAILGPRPAELIGASA